MNRSTKRRIILGWLSTSTAVLLTAATTFAQDATVGVGASTTIPSGRARTSDARTGDAGEGRSEGRAPSSAASSGSSAHEAAVGRIGVGWLGTVDVPVGPAVQAGTPPIPTPVVGIRYWLNSTLGIDAGLGFFTTNSATRTEATTNQTVQGPTRTAFVLHAGVPLSLADVGNFSFVVTPELNVGIGTGKGTNMDANADLSGFLLEGGVRAGAEVFFGFIGIPQLSLEGSAGVFLSSATGKVSAGGGSTRFSTFILSTSSVAQPWDIFRKDIAARYYF